MTALYLPSLGFPVGCGSNCLPMLWIMNFWPLLTNVISIQCSQHILSALIQSLRVGALTNCGSIHSTSTSRGFCSRRAEGWSIETRRSTLSCVVHYSGVDWWVISCLLYSYRLMTVFACSFNYGVRPFMMLRCGATVWGYAFWGCEGCVLCGV